jgi:ribosomal protein S18 acetylase RimI-like enzyme
MRIEQVAVVTPELLRALERLIPQLTSKRSPPTKADLEALLAGACNTLLVLREPDSKGPIVAAGCLAVYRVTTGIRAVIEDVVVDQSVRGRGIGEALVLRLLDLARTMGAPGVSLTSNPRRDAANRLYLRLGFGPRSTNAYYYEFPSN